MRIKSRHYLYLVPKNPKNKDKIRCNKCDSIIYKGELIYTKPSKKHYCAECSYTLGFITGVEGDREN